MAAIKAWDNIYSVGVQDKKLKVFDIVMHTHHGTTYNAYIVQGSNKTVLIEAVKDRFCDEFVKNIEEVCPLESIDYIIASHTEPDHSGSLQCILQKAKKAVVLASQTALTFLGEIIDEPFEKMAVAEGDVIDIGGLTLNFFYTPMLHWPDTIFTWIPEVNALFTCDVFGCHYADDKVFNDLMDHTDFGDAYKYYFDNIIGPFKQPHMLNALDKICHLDIKFVGNGHGPILRKDIEKYLTLYREWASPAPKDEKKIAIAYVSAYGYTKSLALEVEKGLRDAGINNIDIFDLVDGGMNEAQKAIENADGIMLGSPTLVGDAPLPMYKVILGLNPIVHRGRFAAAFGSYGWSGEATNNIAARFAQLHMEMPLPVMRVRFKPSKTDLAAAREYGCNFAKAVLGV